MKKSILYWGVLGALVAVFLFSAGSLIKYFTESNQSQKTYQSLQTMRGDVVRDTAAELVAVEDNRILPELAELYALNSDLVGWLTISSA